MCLIKDDMPRTFEFAGDAIFEPHISVGSGESKKKSIGGMVLSILVHRIRKCFTVIRDPKTRIWDRSGHLPVYAWYGVMPPCSAL